MSFWLGETDCTRQVQTFSLNPVYALETDREIFVIELFVIIAFPSLYGHSTTALEGKRAILKCTTKYTKPYSIRWRFQGKVLENDTYTQITGHRWTKLTIRPVTRRHSGVYECKIDLDGTETNIVAYPQLTVYCKFS